MGSNVGEVKDAAYSASIFRNLETSFGQGQARINAAAANRCLWLLMRTLLALVRSPAISALSEFAVRWGGKEMLLSVGRGVSSFTAASAAAEVFGNGESRCKTLAGGLDIPFLAPLRLANAFLFSLRATLVSARLACARINLMRA